MGSCKIRNTKIARNPARKKMINYTKKLCNNNHIDQYLVSYIFFTKIESKCNLLHDINQLNLRSYCIYKETISMYL
jgi:hypothetical protein